MGFMNWLMKGVGFENEDVYDDSMEKAKQREEKQRRKEEQKRQKEEYKARQAQEKADRFAKRYSLKQEKDVQEKAPQETVSYSQNPDQYNTSSSSFASSASNSYGMGSNAGGFGSKNVEFVYPRKFDDVQYVMNYLKEGESVMLNLNSMNEYDSQRLLDCTYGAIYALNGSIQRVESNIFLLMPEGYNIRTHEQKPQQ